MYKLSICHAMLQGQIKQHWLFKIAAPAKLCAYTAVTLSLWGLPAAHLDTADIWPLGGWLCGFSWKGYHVRGGVAAAPYLVISQVVSNALVRVIVPEAWV